jgi:hypothetical protein
MTSLAGGTCRKPEAFDSNASLGGNDGRRRMARPRTIVGADLRGKRAPGATLPRLYAGKSTVRVTVADDRLARIPGANGHGHCD